MGEIEITDRDMEIVECERAEAARKSRRGEFGGLFTSATDPEPIVKVRYESMDMANKLSINMAKVAESARLCGDKTKVFGLCKRCKEPINADDDPDMLCVECLGRNRKVMLWPRRADE